MEEITLTRRLDWNPMPKKLWSQVNKSSDMRKRETEVDNQNCSLTRMQKNRKILNKAKFGKSKFINSSESPENLCWISAGDFNFEMNFWSFSDESFQLLIKFGFDFSNSFDTQKFNCSPGNALFRILGCSSHFFYFSEDFSKILQASQYFSIIILFEKLSFFECCLSF
jgi:hypothetical protein